jgi:SAM-dependent methyltransferase
VQGVLVTLFAAFSKRVRMLRNASAGPLLLSLCMCPRCGDPISEKGNAIRCLSGHEVRVVDGIVDFVEGRLGTALDDIDYDVFYRVTDENTLLLLTRLKASLAERWPKSFSPSVEIGAGTGYLTVALVGSEPSIDLIVTDVSPKMLQICRSRLPPRGRRQNLMFATYGAEEDFLRPNLFAVCFGSSVLHHILDVRGFLRKVAEILKDDGVSFFLEPNLRYQQVMILTLSEAVASLLATGLEYDERDVILVCNWISEIQQNILHIGDLEFLVNREDKHLFDRKTLASIASQAGLDVEALPYEPEKTLHMEVAGLFQQIGLSDAGSDRFLTLVDQIGPNNLSRLATRDQCQSYVLFFSKRAAVAEPPREPKNEPTIFAGSVRAYAELRFSRTKHAIACDVIGWSMADAPIRSVIFEGGGNKIELAIIFPRPDVQRFMNADQKLPPLNAIHSGFHGKWAWSALPDQILMSARGVAGDVVPIATVSTSINGLPTIISH